MAILSITEPFSRYVLHLISSFCLQESSEYVRVFHDITVAKRETIMCQNHRGSNLNLHLLNPNPVVFPFTSKSSVVVRIFLNCVLRSAKKLTAFL